MDDVEAHYAEGSVGFYPDMPLGVVVRQPVRGQSWTAAWPIAAGYRS
jgi:hypothetical protein